MGNQPQPVPAFLDSLSSEVKLQGTGDQRKFAIEDHLESFTSWNGEEYNFSLNLLVYVSQGKRRRRRATGDEDVINAVLPQGYHEGWYCPPEGGNYKKFWGRGDLLERVE